jgi:hypothetical protein
MTSVLIALFATARVPQRASIVHQPKNACAEISVTLTKVPAMQFAKIKLLKLLLHQAERFA